MIRKVALLLAAVFAMVALACEPAAPAVSPTVAPTATPSPTPTPTPTPTPAAAPSPEQLAVAVKAAIEKAKSFHVDMTMDTTLTSQGLTLQVPFKFDGDFQAPGSMKGALTVAVLGFTIQSEFVQIGDKSWVKDPQSGQWQDSSGESGVAPISPDDLLGETILSADSPVTDFQLVGAETLDGSGVYHYSGTIKAE
ncbi:MAG: LppX_LprAFG lipoprotein, partial [Chloroflexi bacterium]|nr:LppX_LprAFG lipoprotein [Chloroflexota bacterium]